MYREVNSAWLRRRENGRVGSCAPAAMFERPVLCVSSRSESQAIKWGLINTDLRVQMSVTTYTTVS